MTIDEFKEKIAPYMKRGWICYDPSIKYWMWFKIKPKANIEKKTWLLYDYCAFCTVVEFNIEPVEDWVKSLMEVGK